MPRPMRVSAIVGISLPVGFFLVVVALTAFLSYRTHRARTSMHSQLLSKAESRRRQPSQSAPAGRHASKVLQVETGGATDDVELKVVI